MKKFFSITKISSLALLLCVFTACQKDNKELNGAEDFPSSAFKASGKTVDVTFYALAGGVILDKLTTANPETVLSSVTITGLQSGEKILAIDFRPATGQLYGLGSTSRLYVINPETGVARMIGSGPFSPTLSGNIVGFDFNPTVDRIRVVTTSGQNLRLNPETGNLATAVPDGNINGLMEVEVAAVAYTNNMAGASTTILYDIDIKGDRLLKQTNPNGGIVEEVGPLKIKVEGEGGFDIAPNDATALGLFEVNKKSTLFRIDLATGETRIIAKYENNVYTGIAIPTLPVAYAVSTSNRLLIFNPTMPGTVVEKIINVPMGVNILGIDFRPKNGQLYALGSNSVIYTINASSGAATSVATLSTMLSGTSFGFDFNPVVDRIRIVSNTGQNLRFNPADNTVANDGMLAFVTGMGTPSVTAAAYTNNFTGTTSTILFDIDSNTDKLYRQDPPNMGKLVEIGSLGINAEAMNGFDIGGMSGTAWALLTSSGNTKLYMINLSTGAASTSGDFNSTVNGFTVGLGF